MSKKPSIQHFVDVCLSSSLAVASRCKNWCSILYPLQSFLLALTLSSMIGCHSDLTAEEYINWVKDYDNNLHVRSSYGDFIFDLQYQPVEYVMLQRGMSNLSEAEQMRQTQNIGGVQYYTLNISTKNKIDVANYATTSIAERQQKIYYFSYLFQDDVKLEENGKVLPCILYHFERPTKTDGTRTIVLGFKNPTKNATEAQLVIQSELFSSLPIKIKVSKSHTAHVDL